MAHPTDRIFNFFRINLIMRPVLQFVLAIHNKFSEQALLLIKATFICLFLWAIDFGFRNMVTGYFPGMILYACIFLYVLFGSNPFKKSIEIVPEKDPTTKDKTTIDKKVPVQRNSISIEQSLKFRQQLKDHFETTHAFQKQGYTIRDLSKETGIPLYIISSIINQEYGKNFNELVNAYRVEFLAKMFKTSADWGSYTLEAMGKIAGFNSRTAFIASIKKNTGMTPSAFFGRRECEKTGLPILRHEPRMADVA
jgi:AraC-like DNA-binding protein